MNWISGGGQQRQLCLCEAPGQQYNTVKEDSLEIIHLKAPIPSLPQHDTNDPLQRLSLFKGTDSNISDVEGSPETKDVLFSLFENIYKYLFDTKKPFIKLTLYG